MAAGLIGCRALKDNSKYGFNEGYYQSRLFHKKQKKVYVVPYEDSIKVYTVKAPRNADVDTAHSLKIAFPADEKPLQFDRYRFRRHTPDVDVLTILFKYRPAVKDFPQQLNATFNGAVYFGYRTDIYELSYQQTPLRRYKRNLSHYGYSLGVFTGLGVARIDPFVTRNGIAIEYDGVVNPTGVAAIVAVNKLTVGLTAGIDFLLDRNRKYWVNHKKPWIGLGVGLNLN